MVLEPGFDSIWFGIIVVRVTEMGLITPPVGLNVYVIQGITGEPMGTIFRGVIPFIMADVCEIDPADRHPSNHLVFTGFDGGMMWERMKSIKYI